VNDPVVHALLVCRNVSADPLGELTIENVVEIVPVDTYPGDGGPLCFVAFVRNLPTGPGEGAFLLRSGDGTSLGRLPLELDVPPAYEGRQLALHVKLPNFPVEAGGWFEVVFEWAGKALAGNRFAVGAR
jgi:hypothetical protein